VSTGSELHRPLAMVYIEGFIGAIVIRMVAMPVLLDAVCGTAFAQTSKVRFPA
jgi:Cu/Ag efflux pump CusA